MRKLFLAMAVLLLTACGGDETSDDFLSEAKVFLAESDSASAAIQLQNALKLDGGSAEARWLLGKLYLDSGDILAAEKELLRARDLGWDDNDIRPALAKALLAQGRFSEALEPDVGNLNVTAAVDLLTTQVFAALADGQIDKARDLVALAQSKDPQSQEVKLAKATLFLSEGDMPGALLIVEEVLAVAPQNGYAWRLKGQLLLRQEKLIEARDAFDQSIALSRYVFTDRVTRALINVQLRETEAAQAEVTELLALSPSDPTVNYLQGLLYFQNRQYRDAVRVLTLAEPVAREFPVSLFYLALAHLIEDNAVLASRAAGQFVELSPGNASGRRLYAAILVLQDQIKEARAVMRPVLDNNPDDVRALNIMANALLLDDQVYEGFMLYARISRLDPEWSFIPLRHETKLMTVDSGVEDGELPDVRDDYNANFPQTEILQILEFLGNKDFPAAIDAAKAYQFRDLENLSAYYVLARVYLEAGQPEDARDTFEKILKRQAGDSFANANLAQLRLQDNDPAAARRYYMDTLRHNPGDLSALMQLAAMEAREKNATAMVARLKQAIEAHPTLLEPRLRLASYYIRSGSPEKAEPLFAPLNELQRAAPGVLELTALAQVGQAQYPEAAVTLQRLVDVRPATVEYRYLLARAAAGSGDQQKSKAELLQAVTLDGNHLPSLISLARLAASDGDNEQFEKYLATLIELEPDSVDVMRLRAVAARRDGNIEEALAFAEQVYERAPTSQTLLELAALQKAAGEKADAINSLQRWIKNNSADVAVRLSLATEMEIAGNTPAASEQYVAVLALDPENLTALNNLAWNLRYQKRVKALEYSRKAAKIAPRMPAVLDTLAVIEHINGDNKSALGNIKLALTGAPDNVSMKYHKAMIEAALGETDKARSTLEEVLANDASQFPEREDAEKLLNTLSG